MKRKRKLILILILLIIVLLGVVIYFIYSRDVDSKDKVLEKQEEVLTEEEIDEDKAKLDEINNLNLENEHVVGWIKINDSKIDYPILYSGDDYYIYYNYKKEFTNDGSIYIDKHNSLNDINLIIHGHNMSNGNMFHDLINYKDKSYYDDHEIIDFYTLTEHKKYEIISVFLSKVYDKDDDVFKYYKFYGDLTIEEYNDYINNIKDLSLYDSDVTVEYPTKLITLSTCEYSNENGRLVVVAKEI